MSTTVRITATYKVGLGDVDEAAPSGLTVEALDEVVELMNNLGLQNVEVERIDETVVIS